MKRNKNVVRTIIVTIVISFVFLVFNKELIGIVDLIRQKPFETIVLLCLGVLLVVTFSMKFEQEKQ